jgi:hypothetical protein
MFKERFALFILQLFKFSVKIFKRVDKREENLKFNYLKNFT